MWSHRPVATLRSKHDASGARAPAAQGLTDEALVQSKNATLVPLARAPTGIVTGVAHLALDCARREPLDEIARQQAE